MSVLVVLLVVNAGSVQELEARAGPMTFDAGVHLRLRSELQNDFTVKEYKRASDVFLLERVRVDFDARVDAGPRLFVQAQDAHELGSDLDDRDFGSGSPFNNQLDVRQAFVEWHRIHETPIGFKLGRQAIAFSDGRLMGPGDWGNVGRYVWDAAMLTWRSERADVDLFYARRVQVDPSGFDRHHFPYHVLGLFSTVPFGSFDLHGFVFSKIDDSGARVSPGLAAEAKLDAVDGRLGIIPQVGPSVSALGAYAVLGVTAPVTTRPRIGLHYAFGSGDSDPTDETAGTFDGIFGAPAKYYGRMNLFAWMNLHDLQLALSARPADPIRVSLDVHMFLLASPRDAWYGATGKPQRRAPSGDAGQLVGHEVDLVVVIAASRSAQLQAGWGIFIPGTFVRRTGPDELAHWAFVQASYRI